MKWKNTFKIIPKITSLPKPWVQLLFATAFRAKLQAIQEKVSLMSPYLIFSPKMVLHNLLTHIIHHTWLWVDFSYFQKSNSNSKDKDILRIYFTTFYAASKITPKWIKVNCTIFLLYILQIVTTFNFTLFYYALLSTWESKLQT